MARPAWRLGAIGALLLLGGWLRFADLDLMEFKRDEVQALRLAERAVKDGTLPRTGLTASIGIPNPPVFLYLLAPWHAVFDAPVGAAALMALGGVLALLGLAWLTAKHVSGLAALVTLGCAAAAPWFVAYSRKIWSVDLSHLLVLLLMLCLLRMARRPDTRWIAALPALLAIHFGLHFSGVPVCVAALAFALLCMEGRRVRKAWLAAGAVCGALVLLPYLIHLLGAGAGDLTGAADAVGAGGSVARSFGQSLIATGSIFFGGRIQEWAGPAFATAHPTLHASAVALSWLGGGVAAASALVLLVCVGIQCRRAPTLRQGLRAQPLAVLTLLFLLAPVCVYAIGQIQVHNHYFIISLPALFLAAGLAAQRVDEALASRQAVRRIARVGVALVTCALLAGGTLWWTGFTAHLATAGGTTGDYGEAFRFQQAAAQYIAARLDGETDVVLQGLRDSGEGLQYLIWRELEKPDAAARGPAAARIVVTNRLTRTPPAPPPGWTQAPFGPYVVSCTSGPSGSRHPGGSAPRSPRGR